MTSNIGSDAIAELDDKEEIARRINDALRVSFRPEFLNRIDEKIIFNRLRLEDITRIVDIQIKNLSSRLAQRNMTIEIDGKAKEVLGKTGYDPVYGARPLNRVIQKMVQDPIALMILDGRVKEKDRILVSAKNGELEVKV